MKSLLLFSAGLGLGLAAIPSFGLLQSQDPPQTVAQFPDLQRGLLETPGCLGVQTFRADGKGVIAAWFEDRKAMEAWYYSKMHQEAMANFFPGFKSDRKPFAAFKDENTPMLVIASVTPGSKPVGQGSQLAVAQIAIEGYTPVPGGLALGGTFAPEKLNVPGLVRIPVEK